MTPAPTQAELALRHVYDPAPGSIHIKDLIRMAKDGVYAKDKLSDYVIGMILHARDIGDICTWQGTLFQLPFVKGMRLRTGHAHHGQPFLGPDDLILTLADRTLKGSENNDIDESPLTKDTITSHPNYQAWLKDALYAGGEKESHAYKQVYSYNTLKDCDAHVNSLPYTPGPNTRAPGSGILPLPPAKKRRAGNRGTPASSPAAPKPSSRPTNTKKRTIIKLRNKRAASPEAKERPSKKIKKDQEGKREVPETRIKDFDDEAAEEAEGEEIENYGLFDSRLYDSTTEDEGEGTRDDKKDNKVPEGDLAKEEGGGEAEEDAAEEDVAEGEGGEEAEGGAVGEEGGKDVECSATERESSEAGKDQATEGLGGENIDIDALEGGGGASDDDEYDPSPTKPRKNRPNRRKAGASGGDRGKRKGKGKPRA